MVLLFLSVLGICLNSGVTTYSFHACDKPRKVLCENVFVANECGVLEWCIEMWHTRNWSRFAMDLSVPCLSCLAMNTTQHRQLVSETCKVLSPNADGNECKALEQQLRFDNRLAKDGAVVLCNILSVCKSHKYIGDAPHELKEGCSHRNKVYSWINRPNPRRSPKWTSYSSLLSQGPRCQDCVAVVDAVKVKLNDPTLRQQIKKAIEDTYCRNLSILEEICDHAVSTQLDKAIDNIVHSPSRPFCAAFGMCSSCGASDGHGVRIVTDNQHRTRLLIPQLPLTNAIPVPGVCHVCEIVFEKLVELVIDEVTEERITLALNKVCKLIPTLYESQCEELVKQYATQIVEAIIKGTAPKLACASLGLCLSDNQLLNDPEETDQSLETVRLIGSVVRLITSTKSWNIECAVCKTMASMVYSMLNDSAKMNEVKGQIKMLCTLLPSSYVDKCMKFVDNDFEFVLDYIKHNVPEDQVCTLIGVCPAEASTLCSNNPDFACSSLQSALQCSAVQRCIALGKGANLVVVNKSICDQMPLSDICSSLELTHSCGKVEKCQLYRLAAMFRSPSPSDVTPIEDRSDNCGFCINMIDTLSLRRHLYGVSYYDHQNCQPNTKAYKTCQALVAKQKEVMSDIISGRFTSLQICKRHSLCGLSDVAISEQAGDVGRRKSSLGSSCADGFSYWCSSMEAAVACNAMNYCKTFGYFSSSVGNSNPAGSKPAGSDQHNQLDLDPCDFGATYWCQSRSNAEKCGPDAVRHCETLVWPQSITKSLQHPLGTKPCTWGPSLWCSSMENAKMCGKVAYCRSIKRLENE